MSMKLALALSLAAAVAVAQPAPVPPPAPAPQPAPPAAQPGAPVAAPQVPRAVPSLKPDKEGYCQSTEFVGWSKDGSEAAYAESFCKEPPPDQAYDTLYLVTRDGRVKRWLIGAEAGATMKLETRAKLLFGDSVRKAGAKNPPGTLTANAKVEGDYLLVTFTPKGDVKAPPPVTRELRLPYAKWPFATPPSVGEVFWSPDGGAFAVTVKAVRKEPGGGKLPVSAVTFVQLAPLPPAPVPPAGVPAPAPAPAPAPSPAPAPRK